MSEQHRKYVGLRRGQPKSLTVTTEAAAAAEIPEEEATTSGPNLAGREDDHQGEISLRSAADVSVKAASSDGSIDKDTDQNGFGPVDSFVTTDKTTFIEALAEDDLGSKVEALVTTATASMATIDAALYSAPISTTSANNETSAIAEYDRTLQFSLDDFQPTIKSCPLGWICSRVSQHRSPCKRLQDKAYTTLKLGGIYDGIYCPANESTFENCPVGHYCPNASAMLPCPAGYFCPHKTLVPELSCRDCDEKSKTLARAMWGDELMISLAALFVVLYLVSLWYSWYVKRKTRREEMEEKYMTAEREKALRIRERARLNRIRPRLEEMALRIEDEIKKQKDPDHRRNFSDYDFAVRESYLSQQSDRGDQGVSPFMVGSSDHNNGNGETGTPPKRVSKVTFQEGTIGDSSDERKEDDDFFDCEEEDVNEPPRRATQRKFMGYDIDGNFWFDADILFDTVDIDGSEDLSYKELNAFMQLEGNELDHFIRTMNELGGIFIDDEDLVYIHQMEVPRHIFVEYFLEALEVASNFHCTKRQAELLFDEMVAAKANAQEDPRKKSKRRFSSKTMAKLRASGTSSITSTMRAKKVPHLYISDLFDSRCAAFMSEAQINALAKRIRNEKRKKKGYKGSDNVAFTREEFARYYPKMLYDITGRDMSKRVLREKSNLAEGFDLAFRDLCLSVKVGGKSINVVNHVTGRLQAKTMTAVMGGSGSGKTSLLNVLSGRASYGEMSGVIRINGIKSSIAEHKSIVGYVPQDDIVFHELTVRENLLYSGRFQLKAGMSNRAIEDLVDEIIASLGLTKVKDSIVGDVGRRGVSGGERKRVNIGIELMRKPQILYLDEPTSGLDSSSAMLLAKCLRSLVSSSGITVCAVIHQPRKYIFDLFHSLILLADGGNMVYAGPTAKAEEYFTNMSYVLPSGEGVADWLIDCSTGQIRPVRRGGVQSALAQSYYQKSPVGGTLGDKRKKQGLQRNTIEKSLERAKLARQNLARKWDEYFADLDHLEKEQFLPPKRFALPKERKRPGFIRQVSIQIRRNLLIIRRNWRIKCLETVLIVGAVALISSLEGLLVLTDEFQPLIPYEDLASDDASDHIKNFEQIFAYATLASKSIQEYALKVGAITAVLLGLAASRVITAYKLQFNRESASGYDPFAYFLAINFTSTLEHGIQILLASVVAYWLRDSAAPLYAYFVNFVLLGWLTISWSFLISVITPPSSCYIAIGFFMAFFGLLFSGGLGPATYQEIYNANRKALAAFCGLVSPTRYFIEMSAVNEHRSLPAQSGFTYIASQASDFPLNQTSFDTLYLAQNDPFNVIVRSEHGWYWSVLPAIIVGLTVRLLCGIILAFKGRHVVVPIRKACAKQLQKPFMQQFDVFDNIFFWLFVAVVATGYLVGVSIWLILREIPDKQ